MQDEVNTKVVAIMIKGGKISAEVLKKALDKFVQEIEKAQKQMQQPKTYRGKQSIKHLMSQNAAISNIEVTDGNIKSFERTASKYGLDFALKKDVSVEPPNYLVFFKGRDVDVMTAAFKEFSAKTVKQKEQPSIRHKLDGRLFLLLDSLGGELRPSGTSWIRRKPRARRSTRRRSRPRPRIGVWSCEQARCEEAHSSEPSVCLRLLLRG